MESTTASTDKKDFNATSSGAKQTYPWLKATLQIIPYSIICLCLLEAVFYLARVGESDHLMPDSKLGFKPFPNKRVTQRNEGFGSFRFNSFGMQNDEITISKPANVIRIAIFGDSCVESLQVPREKNYCSLLTEKLTAKLKQPVQVLNFGVSNYSLVQNYLRYQTLAKKFQPDLVIVAYRIDETEKILPANKPSLAYIRPLLYPDQNGRLVYDDTPVRNFSKSKEGKRVASSSFLRENCRIWSTIGRMQQSMQQNPSTLAIAAPEAKSSITKAANDNNREKFVTCYWYLIDALFKNFATECAANNTSMLIIRTPTVSPGEYILCQNKVETRLLEATAKETRTGFIDINQLLQTNVKDQDYHPYFLEASHYSKLMHNFVADQLTTKIANDIVNKHRPSDNKSLEIK